MSTSGTVDVVDLASSEDEARDFRASFACHFGGEAILKRPKVEGTLAAANNEDDLDIEANMKTFTAKELADQRMSKAIESGNVINLCDSDDEDNTPPAHVLAEQPLAEEQMLARYLHVNQLQPSNRRVMTRAAGPAHLLKLLHDYQLLHSAPPGDAGRPEQPPLYTAAALNLRNKNDLKHLCRQHGLKVSGNKPDLIARLVNMNQPTLASQPPQPPWRPPPPPARAPAVTPQYQARSASTPPPLIPQTPLTVRIPTRLTEATRARRTSTTPVAHPYSDSQ